MIRNGAVIKGNYLDSVKLMLISKHIRMQEGISDAVVMMASFENRAILKASGFLLPEFEMAADTDLLLAVEAGNAELGKEMIDQARKWIENGLPRVEKTRERDHPQGLAAGLRVLPEASLALISIAGKYAAREANKALDLGLHVLLFSDNVSLQAELELKLKALSKGLLMMGPDCGTAIINGMPLAFANRVRGGEIGIVSASGTGLQEVSSTIHNLGAGISQAFGTGGRDGKAAIGGLMLCACLDYLIKDAGTKVIIIISKVPDQSVIDKLWALVRTTQKQVVINFLRDFECETLSNVIITKTISETARRAVNCLPDIPLRPCGENNPKRELVHLPKGSGRKYLRGLFSGGTLCYEAQMIFWDVTGIVPFSNVALLPEGKLEDSMISKEHCIIDMGSDEFTVGQLHPMIDFSQRIRRIKEELQDPQTAVLLLDIVLGNGAHPAPQEELVPLLQRKNDIVVICSVIGTELDPQNRTEVIRALRGTGAVVTGSNSEACMLAAGLIKNIGSE